LHGFILEKHVKEILVSGQKIEPPPGCYPISQIAGERVDMLHRTACVPLALLRLVFVFPAIFELESLGNIRQRPSVFKILLERHSIPVRRQPPCFETRPRESGGSLHVASPWSAMDYVE
jgi:hypothetical protein